MNRGASNLKYKRDLHVFLLGVYVVFIGMSEIMSPMTAYCGAFYTRSSWPQRT